MASSINASTSGAGGVITTADNSGILNLQSNGTTVATVSSTGFSTPANQTINTANTFGFKNRLINGGMTISQYNGTSSVTPANNSYPIDRYKFVVSQASKFTAQQLSASPPAGFTNYLGLTVSSAVTIGTTDYFEITQPIEGYNIADLGWGTANAKTVTLSFWVQSSLTGTFGGAIANASGTRRSYPFSYTISSANTWTQISITIPGDTTGTWPTDNSLGIYVRFGLGVGSTYSTTAGAWASGIYDSATGATSVVGTNGATFYITGVQLEVGSQATSFDFRDYGRELDLCQRYYEIGSFTQRASSGNGNYMGQFFPFSTTKRTGPSMTASGTSYPYGCSSLALAGGYTSGFEMYVYTTGPYAVSSSWSASAEL